MELDGAAGQSLLLLIVWLDRAVLKLREIRDRLTLLHESHALLILEHLLLLVLELRMLLHVRALHLLLLRH